jgi:hypothetical protein
MERHQVSLTDCTIWASPRLWSSLPAVMRAVDETLQTIAFPPLTADIEVGTKVLEQHGIDRSVSRAAAFTFVLAFGQLRN